MDKYLRSPQAAFSTLWRRITRPVKAAFLTAFISGVLIYLFAITNTLVGSGDALNNVVSGANQVGLGRWSCSWLCSLSTVYSMPLVNGLMMILAVSLLAVVVTMLLEIRSTFFAMLAALVLIAYPSVGDTLKYLHLADGYMIAALLAVTALYLADRYRFGWAAGVPLLTLALGTYQAYASLAAALMFVRGVQLVLRPSSENRALLKLVLRYVLLMAISMALYYGLARFFSGYYGIPLSDYQSVSSMGSFSPQTLLNNFLGCYRDFKSEITFLSYRADFYVNGYANYLYVACTLGLTLAIYLTGAGKSVLKSVLLAALLALAPFLLCSVRVFNPAKVYSLMTYSVVGLYLLGIVLMEQLPAALKRLAGETRGKAALVLAGRKWMRVLLVIVSWLMILCLIVALYAWIVGENLDYYREKLDFENMYAQCSAYLQTAENTDGYSKNMPIYIIGSAAGSAVVSRTQTLLNRPKYFYAFMRYYLGVDMPFGIAGQIDMTAYAFADTEAFAGMPAYPAAGCAAVVDGGLYLKLSGI
ncbi:MAG: glucosyltransferase domain-containing protein [Eubacteriales bacterium]|nr:glucosyltransferase domain-containing protein [Eubacteriales bacterium]